jgi:uncharacterized DUF497 family protein
MRFVWDPIKAKNNFEKHRVSFEEAATAFVDQEAIRIHDPEHSESEDRWILLGLSRHIRVLVVVHVEREEDVIRIISARKANRKEQRNYIKERP